MHNRFKSSISALAGLLAAVAINGSIPAVAQTPDPKPHDAKAQEVKSWPANGVWRTALVQRAAGEYMCMLNGFGQESHSFGVSIMEMPGRLLLAVDDRNSTQGYLPTMVVQIDGQPPISFTTFNDPPMTSTAPTEANRVRILINRLVKGQNLTIDARRAQYKLSLEGFRTAAAQLRACRFDIATLPLGGTVGRGNR